MKAKFVYRRQVYRQNCAQKAVLKAKSFRDVAHIIGTSEVPILRKCRIGTNAAY